MKYCTMELCLGNIFLENVVTDYEHLKDIFKLDILWCFSKCVKEGNIQGKGQYINK